MERFDAAIVGGGIVGLATGWTLLRARPGLRLVLLEKEGHWAAHQTGHNSGVVHSGVYYRPGSAKAVMARTGGEAMISFCQERGLPVARVGKVIVAANDRERERLRMLADRGAANGLRVALLDPAGLAALEPHAAGAAALHVPETAIVDYRLVSGRLAEEAIDAGGELRCGAAVLSITSRADGMAIQTAESEIMADLLINCAGLQCDRVARMAGARPAARIIPFRGEYFELPPDRAYLVNSLIYPVPDERFPFLGVHLTRMVDGTVHAGPNAVLSWKREGYRRGAFSARDALEVLAYSGMARLAARHWRTGMAEVARSLSRRLFASSLQRLLPEITSADLTNPSAGVRAQAVLPDGRLVDDFLISEGERAIHLLNAPSPAATASLAIGEHIAALGLRRL